MIDRRRRGTKGPELAGESDQRIKEPVCNFTRDALPLEIMWVAQSMFPSDDLLSRSLSPLCIIVCKWIAAVPLVS